MPGLIFSVGLRKQSPQFAGMNNEDRQTSERGAWFFSARRLSRSLTPRRRDLHQTRNAHGRHPLGEASGKLGAATQAMMPSISSGRGALGWLLMRPTIAVAASATLR